MMTIMMSSMLTSMISSMMTIQTTFITIAAMICLQGVLLSVTVKIRVPGPSSDRCYPCQRSRGWLWARRHGGRAVVGGTDGIPAAAGHGPRRRAQGQAAETGRGLRPEDADAAARPRGDAACQARPERPAIFFFLEDFGGCRWWFEGRS